MVTSTTSQYNSSTIKSASYNAEHKILTVHFNNASYFYKDVTLEDFQKFNNAKSQGVALSEFIKPNYKFEKITEDVNG